MAMKNKPAMKANFLPDEIQENILSRVPVETILRLTFVCKSWYSLFLNPRFISMHQKHNSNTLLLARLHKTRELVVTDTSSIIHSRLAVKPRSHSFAMHGQDLDVHKNMVLSCNGIVCIHGIHPLCVNGTFSEHICLWNPALRVFKYIEVPGGVLVANTEQVLVGFGFDSHSNDYKVIRYQENPFVKGQRKVEIYSLSTDTWRRVNRATRSINGFFMSQFFHARASGVYVNETHHWAVIGPNYIIGPNYEVVEESTAFIVSFKMRDEVFKKITVPNEICEKRELKMILFNYNEFLATLTYSQRYWGNTDHDIWVMKDCGKSESWTKICNINLPKMSYFRGFDQNKNELIFSDGHVHDPARERIIVFDTDKLEMKDDDNSTTNIEVLKEAIEVTTFRESLLLLNSKNLVRC